MKILLVLPAGETVRVTRDKPRVPRRGMLRFSVLPLTTVAALTPPEHEVSLCDENVQALDLDADMVGALSAAGIAVRRKVGAVSSAICISFPSMTEGTN